MAGISFGPKLGLINNANIGQEYFDQFRVFLQAIDQLVQMSVLNATQTTPPNNPNPGDAYLLIGGTPSGAWTGFAGSIASWNTQLTTTGSNTQVPSWVFYTPQPGWILWNVSTASLIVFNGTSWGPVGQNISLPVSVAQGGTGSATPAGARTNLVAAESGANTDITSLGGIPNTTINSSGYALGAPASGTGINITETTVSGGITDNTHAGYELGFNIGSGSGATLLLSNGSGQGVTLSAAGGLSMNGGLVCGTIQTTGNIDFTSGGILNIDNFQNFAPGTPSTFNAQASGTPMQAALIINAVSSTSGTNLLGFTNYPTQTTVGAAGTASALPSAPSLYLQLSINGTVFVFPGYKQS